MKNLTLILIVIAILVAALGATFYIFLGEDSGAGLPAKSAQPAIQTPQPISARPESKITAPGEWQGYPQLSPFEAVRWQGDTPDVQVAGTWYELLALNDQTTAQIVTDCRSLDENDWQRRFDQDLVEVLTRTGHKPGPLVTLKVKEPKTGAESTLKDVPMTAENRRALLDASRQQPH